MLFFKKKKKNILTEEDNKELRELERKAYLEEARKLVLIRGKEQANIDLSIKIKTIREEEF